MLPYYKFIDKDILTDSKFLFYKSGAIHDIYSIHWKFSIFNDKFSITYCGTYDNELICQKETIYYSCKFKHIPAREAADINYTPLTKVKFNIFNPSSKLYHIKSIDMKEDLYGEGFSYHISC
ncbi:hypothetical protein HL033_00385 [Neoehrlichia mikurensis]|uniref:Uncharacterized protein n=1 Tax=Neoehrlichia mikurensis TaxID=89586 RepID=A0A9Q9BYV2_9RICK|nr:hypothetical protein [Neoehrlichia mikurensis]QXK92034.1 hypothetical protein IAH97_00385 [Neoehrlichia mikurensis]QXK92492.1 hypothetical protein HUN61_00385 [Neoehrlichia mikurensis]QXK93727.1 hypothetical protein HL033_00385 [Neoehrlichia mikurensis]UTO55299.1 hypothetical protein LUA82_03895 [Neoehrlichia mikurensis]UTO56219.1 hypothetical protein LUA81_03860 [Neoehrlichia mikurensis]